jgi:hypothetical protein
MNKLKTLCIAALLLFTVNAAMAQDKYEYAIINIHNQGDLTIFNGTDVKTVKTLKGEIG